MRPSGRGVTIAPVAKRVGGVDILTSRVRRQVDHYLGDGDEVLFCLRGSLGQSLVALPERVLVVKPGFHAGTTFGSLVTNLHYGDVTGVQVHTFLLSGWIEISSPSFQGRERKRAGWPHGRDRDVYKLPHCVPIARRHLQEYEPALRRLLAQISLFKPRARTAGGKSPLRVEIDEVDGLVAAGVLSRGEHSRIQALLRSGDHEEAAAFTAEVGS